MAKNVHIIDPAAGRALCGQGRILPIRATSVPEDSTCMFCRAIHSVHEESEEQHEESEEQHEENAKDHVRLSVNVSHATARAFRELIGRKNVTVTDGVRRAIAVWKFVEDEVAAGNRLAVVTPDGTVHAVTLLDSGHAMPGAFGPGDRQ